jgi:uncharacterized RDD family membrane protein YckC
MFYQLGILIIRHKRGGMIEKQYQTFWPRVGASFIDTAIFYPFDLIARLVIYTLHPSLFLIIFWDQFYTWAWVAYSILMHGYKGQTLGKMVCKVRVLDITENKLSLSQAFMRDIVLIISNFIFSLYILFNSSIYIKLVTSNNFIEDFSAFPIWFRVLAMMSFIWTLLEIITMLTNKKRRAIHDFIAGSVVKREA